MKRELAILATVAALHGIALWPTRGTPVPFSPRASLIELSPAAGGRESGALPAHTSPRKPLVAEAARSGETAEVHAITGPEAAAPTESEATAADLARWGNPAPAYPEAARQAGDEGTVVVRVEVAEGGVAGNVVLFESSGHEALDGAVLEAAKRWKFPAAVGAKYRVRVAFALQ